LEHFVETNSIVGFLQAVRDWIFANVLVVEIIGQIPVIVAAAVAAWFAARLVRRRVEPILAARPAGVLATRFITATLPLAYPLFAVILLWLTLGIATQLDWPQPVTRIAASLITAWVVIRLVTNLLGSTTWTRLISIAIWIIAALNILQLLDPTIAFLDSIAVTLGELRLSALTVIKSIIVFGILIWAATLASRFVERRIEKTQDLSPSMKVLIGKLVRITLIALAVVLALNSVGLDLSGLAILSGAIGLGIGFGLQRIVSNLISGVILLTDKSIKPGDVLEIGGTYGWIKSLSARYVSIVTRDGTEHLIPNEMLIAERVVNWSFSDNKVRLNLNVGVSYKSDVHQAIALCLQAATATARILTNPEPVCFIVGFGDSSVDLQLRFWIDDPQNGTSNVRGAVFLEIWDRFHEHGIEIPFPQRDLHLKSPADLSVVIDQK